MKQIRAVTVWLIPVALVLCIAACAATPPAESNPAVTESNPPAASPWQKAASPAELVGHWEGATDIAIPRNTEMELPQSHIDIVITLDYTAGARQVTLTMKVDMDRFLSDWVALDAVKVLGVTKDSLWSLVEQQFRAQGNFNTGKYFLAMDLSETPEKVLDPDAGVSIFTNPARNQLRLVFNETISFNLGDEGFREITLNKAGGVTL
jgi:hypothetical protein